MLEKGGQDRLMRNDISQAAEPTLLTVTSSKGEISVPFRFHYQYPPRNVKSLSRLQVTSRARLSYAALRLTNTTPAFLISKESSLFCDYKTT